MVENDDEEISHIEISSSKNKRKVIIFRDVAKSAAVAFDFYL